MNPSQCPLVGMISARQDVCLHSDVVWKAIQAEAQELAEREPFLAATLRRQVLDPPNLTASLATVISEQLFPGQEAEFVLLMRDVVADDRRLVAAIHADLQAIRQQDPATHSYLNPFLHFKGFLALESYRVAHWLWHHDRQMLALHIQSRISQVWGVDIHPAARIGQGAFLDHATGIVIGETAEIGRDTVLMHGVTLGSTGKQAGDRHPKLADGVFVGAGAHVLGNISVSPKAKIGAGAVVVKPVAAGGTVIGPAARAVAQTPAAKVA